ncbi:MAG: DUF2157 domain-containing protein [Candidatus Eremiobacteraeota bacterium]|nr:DUF2157 domain-containing protein [Candidatus Eremiobacteraeota bacterium]MCW5866138.1 DUF2157 domain-containing protein [Candidatus Eremiobacteraeota bacterium]
MSNATIEEVANFADRQNWSHDARVRAYALATRPADAGEWSRFLDQNLLAGGALAFVSGASFLVAANWSWLGAYGKFLLLELLLVGLALSAWRTGLQQLKARWALTVACGLVGALLALYKQTYPGEDDGHLLFWIWAGLTLPWTLLLRFEPAWALWLGVANLALAATWEDAQLTGMLNLAWWGLAAAYQPRFGWTQIPLTVCWFSLTGAALFNVFDKHEPAAFVAWIAWVAATTFYAYRRRHKGTLAALGFSVILLVTAALLRGTAEWADMNWLFILGVAVSVQVAGLIYALRRLPE